MKFFARSLFLLASWLLAGCASFGPDAPGLEVTLVHVRLREATVWETTVEFTVREANATPGPVQLTGAAHKIYLNGAYVGQGLASEPLEVPRLGSATQTFTAHLRNLSLAGRVRTLVESRRFEYRLASLLYTAPQGRRLRLANEGVLDLNEFQPRR